MILVDTNRKWKQKMSANKSKSKSKNLNSKIFYRTDNEIIQQNEKVKR